MELNFNGRRVEEGCSNLGDVIRENLSEVQAELAAALEITRSMVHQFMSEADANTLVQLIQTLKSIHVQLTELSRTVGWAGSPEVTQSLEAAIAQLDVVQVDLIQNSICEILERDIAPILETCHETVEQLASESAKPEEVMKAATSNVAHLLATEPKRIFVIAEAGLNHGGSKERALALVRAAKWAGADAVKFQSFRIERVADSHPVRTFAGQGLKLQVEFKNPELSPDALRAVFQEAHRLEIEIFAAPHDEDSTDLSDKLGARAFKIDSGGISRRPWIKHVGRKGKPVLFSTEMSSTEDVRTLMEWMSEERNEQSILLHGVSAYPATGEELNLKVIHQLRKRFGVPIGFMDNTIGGLAAITAVSLGAQLIERHLSVDNLSSTEAQAVSMDPKHFKAHIEELRRIGVILKARESHAEKPRVHLAVAANR